MKLFDERFRLWLLRLCIAIFALSALVTILTGCASDARTSERRQAEEQRTEIVRESGVQVLYKFDPAVGQLRPDERREWQQEIQRDAQQRQQQRLASETSTAYTVPAVGGGSWLSALTGGFGAEAALGGVATVLAWLWWKVRDQRNQLIRSVEHAREVLPDDVDKQFTTVLATRQDRDLQKVVQKYTNI